jgi:excisionase family DNA binding protein
MVLMVAEEQWLTVEQVAERLQVHIETVRRWIRSGDLPSVRLGRRAGYRIKAADLEAFLDRQYRRGP